MAKAKHRFIDEAYLQGRTEGLRKAGYGKAKWILFCEAMLRTGYRVQLYETPHTKSKYVTVHGAGDVTFKVRFSDHKPIKHRELAGDCDFFVGKTHTGSRSTYDAINAVRDCFNAL